MEKGAKSLRATWSIGRSALPASVSALVALACSAPRTMADPVALPQVNAIAAATALDYYSPTLATGSGDSLPFSIFLLEQVPQQFTSPTGSAAVKVNGGLDPSLSASASVSLPCAISTQSEGCGWDASANAGLDYWFAIEGPATTATIPVSITGSESLSQGFVQTTTSGRVYQEAVSTADLGVYTYSGNLVTSTASGGGAFTDQMNLQVGALYDVNMSVNAVVKNSCQNDIFSFQEAESCNGSGSLLSASATIDPKFTIDGPTLANEYSIEFSPGLLSGAETSVPDPDTVPLLLGGGVALALVRRRRRR